MSSNVFQVVQAFLRDSGIAHVFLGFLWKMLEDVLEDVGMSYAYERTFAGHTGKLIKVDGACLYERS